ATVMESVRVPRFPFYEDVVVDFIDARGQRLSRAVKGGVERLPLLTGEVLLGRPVVGLERLDVGPPFQVVAQLVGQRLPGLVTPLELRGEPGQRCEGAGMEDHSRLQVGAASRTPQR